MSGWEREMKFFVAVAQLNFDQYDAPSTPAFMPVNRKKKRKDPFRDSSSYETKPLRISAEAKR